MKAEKQLKIKSKEELKMELNGTNKQLRIQSMRYDGIHPRNMYPDVLVPMRTHN